MQIPQSNRATGRTTRAIAYAVFAAATGNRVVYVCPSHALAKEARRIAAEFLESCSAATQLTATHTDTSIKFYRDGYQGEIGRLLFRSLEQEECSPINRGLPLEKLYTIVDDHYVTEMRAEAQREAERLSDISIIRKLMRKHGWKHVETVGSQWSTSITLTVGI